MTGSRTGWFLNINRLPHVVALSVWALIWLWALELGAIGQEDLFATWGNITIFTVVPAITVGAIVGRMRASHPRLSRFLVVASAFWVTLVAFLVVCAFRDLYCGFQGFQSCTPSVLDRLTGLAGIESALIAQWLSIRLVSRRNRA